MVINKNLIIVILLFSFALSFSKQENINNAQSLNLKSQKTDKKNMGETNTMKFTILYDNYVFKQGTKSDWGFSCLIEGMEKTILFDTGTKRNILIYNISQMKVVLNEIDQIVISHNHRDHTGGLISVLEKNCNVSVYLPESFPDSFIKQVEEKGAKIVMVSEPVEICKDVFSTGEMGFQIKEQGLILDTPKGLVVVVGCSHPGIVEMLERAKEVLNKNIYLVFGGFHLRRYTDQQVKEIIYRFKKLGVTKVGATHCTGDRAIALFKEAYGENYVQIGTGNILEVLNEELE